MGHLEFPPAPEYGATPQYPIESVDNALRVMLLFGERSSLRLTDVSRFLGVASSTAHRLLAMLQYRGFVRQDAESRGYVPGPALDGMAFGILRRLDARTVARPVLERLRAELQETIHLGRLDGSDVHFIDSIESSRALRVGGRLGRSMPAHCTSTGKALLAGLGDEELLTLYPTEELPQLTTHSIGTRTDLLKAVTAIRGQGYAISQEESEEGVSSVAVALPGRHAPRLSVAASAPVTRMTKVARQRALTLIFAAVEEIDQLLP